MKKLITFQSLNKAQLQLCFVLFFIFTFSLGYGQPSISDSLYTELEKANEDSVKIMLLLQIAKQQVYSDINESTELAEKALTLANKSNLKEAKARIYDLMGVIYTIKADYYTGIDHFKTAITIFKEINSESNLAKSYGNLATGYQFIEDFEKSLQAQLFSLQISEKLNDSVAMGISYINLGNIHSRLENIVRAEKYYRKAYQISVKTKQQERIVESLSNLSLVLLRQQKTDSALYYATHTINVAKKNNFNFLMFRSIEILGSIHLKKKNYDLAKQNFLLAKPVFEKSEYEYAIISNYIHLGKAYSGLELKDSAIYYYHRAIKIGLKNDYQIHALDAYEGLTKLFINNNQKDSALYYFEKSIITKNELISNEKTKILERFQTEYETLKKDEEITLLQEQNKVKDVLLEKRTYFMATLSLTVILLLTGGFFLRRQIKLKQQKIASELEHKALRAQMNPHFIFNSLNAIQDMYVAGEMDLANNFMADFGELMRKILDNSGKSKISIKEEMDTLKLYLEMEKIRSGGLLSYHINIHESIDQLNTFIPPLIIQPFVENAVWHGILIKKEKGNVRISLKKINEKLVCIIEDDGIGFENSTKNKNSVGHESKGMKLTEQRLGFPVKIEELNPGTRITLTISI